MPSQLTKIGVFGGNSSIDDSIGAIVDIAKGELVVRGPHITTAGIQLAHGLVVAPIGPFADVMRRHTQEFEGRFAGGRESWMVRMRVVQPAHGFGELETQALNDAGQTVTFRIANQEGETFAQTAITGRPSIAVE